MGPTLTHGWGGGRPKAVLASVAGTRSPAAYELSVKWCRSDPQVESCSNGLFLLVISAYSLDGDGGGNGDPFPDGRVVFPVLFVRRGVAIGAVPVDREHLVLLVDENTSAADLGLNQDQVRVTTPSLEDVFVALAKAQNAA